MLALIMVLAEVPALEMQIWQGAEHPLPKPQDPRGDATLEQRWMCFGAEAQGSGLQGFWL